MRPRLRWIDTSDPFRWKCELPGAYSIEEFAEEFDRATDVIRSLPHNYRFVYLADLSLVRSSNPKNRQRVARFLSECEEPLKMHMIAWGNVFSNPVLSAAQTAVTWLRSFPVPTRAFTDRTECEHWLDQQLARDQLARER